MNQSVGAEEKVLPPQWQQWLLDNLRRGCSPAELAEILRQNGLQDCTLTLSDSEVGFLNAGSTVLHRPQPQTSANSIEIDGHSVVVAGVLDHPQIIFWHNLLSPEECDALCQLAEQSFVQATVVDDVSGAFVHHPHRTSDHTCFSRGQTELIATLEKRIAAVLNWPVENGEGLQVLRYATGGEYRAHFDYFDPDQPGSRKQMESGGQRVGTMLMYLSDVEAGGGTRFPELGLEVRPRKGSAVYFASVDAFGVPDKQSLHASVPVVSGIKYAATKWIREKAFA